MFIDSMVLSIEVLAIEVLAIEGSPHGLPHLAVLGLEALRGQAIDRHGLE
jgi:hypothetical protein